ncbi:Alpha/Beta hydrolase protein [Ilyonectria destructans]|nr:Alpha/Beta hydrolase protein [Ilyonectria destructans]
MTGNLACCAAGHPANDGFQAYGQSWVLGQIQVYESRPPGDIIKGTLIMLPDGFGLASHNLLLADMFAQRGWVTLVPDYFQGDAVPISLLQRDRSKPLDEVFDMRSWLERHLHESVERHVRFLYEHVRNSDAIDELGPMGERPIAIVGYCFGGKHALRASSWPGIHVAAAFHPSFVQRDDVGNEAVGGGCRTFVGLAENDEMVPETLGDDLNRWAAEKSRKITQRVFPGVGHGFAARPASKVETEMVQFRDAFEFACTALEGK